MGILFHAIPPGCCGTTKLHTQSYLKLIACLRITIREYLHNRCHFETATKQPVGSTSYLISISVISPKLGRNDR